MNKIKSFENFQINELKHSTYWSASTKLRKLGGQHHDRARRLQRHSYLMSGRDLGELNLNANLIEKMSKNYLTKQDELMLFISNPNEALKRGETLYQKSPIQIYLTGGHMIDPRESFADEEISDCKSISTMFFGIPSREEKYSETFELFMMDVPITWENNVFKVGDESVYFCEMEHGVLKFADRKSAVKFKNILGNKEVLKSVVDGLDDIREFFMGYSDASEWEKFLDKLKSISTNELYN